MSKLQSFFILFFIIVIAIFLRFYQLSINPPSLTWDEAAWGYNAYALGTDGRDEFGRFLPVDYLESFGDFKPPMYAYLDILPVKVFGLNEFATRFPSAFLGVLTVLVTYFLVRRLFYNSQKKELYALASAGILAISPWHFMLSRAAFEANVATFFLSCGVLLFLGAVQEKKWYLPISILSFVLALYTFNSARIVAPLLLITLALISWRILFQRKVYVFVSILVGLLLFLPIAKFLISPQASLRFKEVNIFSDISVVKTINQEVANDQNSSWSKVIHNRRLAYGMQFLKHYFDNLSPEFLFIKGDGNPKFSTQDVGQMYLWDLPFFVVGVFLLWKKREGYWWIIPLWLILGIIPAATARETPHALRIEATLPTLQIFIAYGFINILQVIDTKKLNKKIILFGVFLILFFNILYFLHGYYVRYPKAFAGEWQYGYKDSITYVQQMKNDYTQIDITDKLGRPYVYYLFYTKTNPNTFRQTAIIKRDVFGFVNVEGFEKYRFGQNLNERDNKNKNKKVLFINDPSQVPLNAHILQTFYLLDGKPTLVAYTL